MRIDLHTHSSASDGTDSPAALIANAVSAGLDVVALTDHDTTAGWRAASTAARAAGITLVPGAEISCRLGDGEDAIPIHMLAYLFDPAEPEFAAERELLRDDRTRRAEAIVERCRELGAPITWDRVRAIAAGAVVGRPHIASALVEAGMVASVSEAFTPDWLADGGRAFVDKYALEPRRALALVRAAGGVPVMAHPAAGSRGRIVTEDYIAELAGAGLSGVEVDHVDHDEESRERLRALAAELGIIATGSSDYHGTRKPEITLGINTTSREAYEAIVARASGTSVVSGVATRSSVTP